MSKSGRIILLHVFLLFIATGISAAAGSVSRDHGSVNVQANSRAVFDVRTSDAKSLLFILKVVEETRAEIVERRAEPHFVLAFRGGTLPLLTAQPKADTAAEKAILEEVRERLTELRRKGVQLEACNVAARLFKIREADLADSLTLVSNSLVSLIAYQNQGYALVPMY